MTLNPKAACQASSAAEGIITPTAAALIDDLLTFCEGRERVTVREVVDRLGVAGFPVLVLALVMPALIPIPGPYGMVFGTAVALLAIQMTVGRPRPWLPAFLTRRFVKSELLVKWGHRARVWLVWIERFHSPGWLRRIAGRQMSRIAGFVVLPLSIMIGLPIPFGNVPPVLAIAMICLALILKDGLALLLAFVAAILAAGWVVTVFWFGGELLARFWTLLA